MARTRYISNARGGIGGSIVRGNVLYTTIEGGAGAGGVSQALHETSLTQVYAPGTRLVTGDGRVFRYAKASNIISRADFGLKFWLQIGDGIAANAGGSSAVGDFTVTLTGTATKDEYTGGYLMTHVTPFQNRAILSNTATSGTTFVVTLAEPLTVALASGSSYCEAMQSPYSNVRLTAGPSGGDSGDDNSSVAGIPFVITTVANTYLWIQTWGPIWVNPWGDAATGVAGGERKLVFDAEGHVCGEDDVAHGPSSDGDEHQLAGFIIDRGGAGPPLIMLQISP